MIKRNCLFSFLIFILQTPIIFGQLQNNNWVFGYGARVNFSGPVPVGSSNAAINSNESTASVSDPSTGQLLFYTDGIKVWNANNQVMPNGSNLLGGFYNSCTQGALIVPFPADDQHYYIFTLDELEVDPTNPVADDGLRYSIVDMTLNGGLGDVQTNNMNTQLGTDLTEKLIVIRSAEIQGFWVIAHRRNTNEFLAWKIDECGISAQPVISAVGSFFSGAALGATEGWMGAMDASPDGNRIGMPVDWSDRLEFFDFNKTTGVVSNPLTVNVVDDSNPPFLRKYGACFSPDGSKFYYTNFNSVYQLDLSTYNSVAIASSHTFIYSTNFQPVGYACGQIEQAPNDKLYVAIGNAGRLDEISNPNAPGLSCGYVANAINLASVCQLGLPTQVPIGDFAPNSTISFLPDSCFQSDISFSIATASPINQISWNFGDPGSGANNTSSQITPSHTFSSPGSYTVTAVATMNCYTDTLQQAITLVDCPPPPVVTDPIQVPNVFTPNGDGSNDVFAIKNLPSHTEVIILNRWGNQVFKASNYQNNWDGKDQSGKTLSEGVYGYVYTLQNGIMAHGFVQLIR